jgi:tetratricopeptide (TPR) repeat protein
VHSIHKFIVSLIFVGAVFANSVAQNNFISETIEEKTYQLYEAKKWDELIKLVNTAIDSGIDYFYLRMRIGIAYYENGNYNLAEKHFSKALFFNSTNDLVKEYLYYCYQYTGRMDQANWLATEFNDSLKLKIGALKPKYNALIEAGVKQSNQNTFTDPISKKEMDYFEPAFYIQLGFRHGVKQRLSLFHAYTHFNQTTYLGKVNQNQYYLSANIPFKNNWLLSPAFHYMQTKFVGKKGVLLSPNPISGPSLDSVYPTSNYFTGALTIQKDIDQFVLSFGTTVSNNYKALQLIQNGFISYSVFGNSKLVVGSNIYLNSISNNTKLYTAIAPFVYFQPVSRFAIKASYLANNGINLIEDNAYLINNSIDLTTSRWSILSNFMMNKNVTIYGLYQLENKQEIIQSFDYKYNVFSLGLKWRL